MRACKLSISLGLGAPGAINAMPMYRMNRADTSVYAASSDSTPDASDRVMDFTSGEDKIDLTAITKGAGLHFRDAFTGGAAGDAVLSNLGGNRTLAVDFSGHGVADLLVNIVGQAAVSYIAA